MLITREQEQILDLLASILFDYKIEHFDIEDYGSLIHEADLQTVLPLVYQALKSQASEEVLRQIQNKMIAVCANNIRINYEHAELHKLFTENQIPYVVMKGSASAAYYPQPELRVMGDVDFLVQKKDLERAGQVLEMEGFQPTDDEENQVHIAYHRQGSAWEMHWEPNGIPGGVTGKKIRRYLSDMIEEEHLFVCEEGTFYVPSQFHHGMILLLHAATHLINTGIGVRHLCDWAVFVNTFSDEEFLKKFEKKLKKAGLWRFAQLLTLLSEKYLHCRTCGWAGSAEPELLETMMADIFAGGNFGKKDTQRINQAKLMTDKKKGSVDDTRFVKQLIRTMNEKACIGMPIIKKFPFLLLAGWIYVGCRHLLRIRRGERPQIHMREMVKGAAERKEIYKRFHLFEPK